MTYQDVWGSGGTMPPALRGDTVDAALRLAPVYSATSLIANLISTAPVEAYVEAAPNQLQRLAKQPQLAVNPSPYRGTRIDWLHQGMASALLTGNAIGYIVDVDAYGTASKVIWFNPTDVTVIEEQADWFHTPQWYWRGRPLDPSLIVHVPAYVMPGRTLGISPIALFKKQIETGLSAQDFQLDWYNNGAAPSGWFKNTSKALKDGQAGKIKERFKVAVKNRDLLVTGSDWDWQALSVPADQAQFLDAIRANATTIASIFHVSPEDIGGTTGQPMTYKTLEQDGIKLNARALTPWARRFEEVLSGLLPAKRYIKIDLDGLARGTVLERAQAHAQQLAIGIETNAEARAFEGKAPLTPDEVAFWQENYKAAAPPAAPAPEATPAEPATPAGPGDGAK